MSLNHNYLVSVYTDTVSKCKSNYYGNLPKSISIKYTNDDSRFFGMIPVDKFQKTKILVLNADVLYVAELFNDEIINNRKNKIMVLNFANNLHAGGGVSRGAMAQEEELFRRSNYFITLTKQFYPIKVNEIIHTSNVTIVKDQNYNDITRKFTVGMIAAAALIDPPTNNNKYTNTNDKIIMDKMIENIFKTSYFLGYHTLILGAFGCGAFNNPKEEIVEIFNKYIAEYNKKFKNIIFAVLDKNNEGNYAYFNSYIVRV